LIEIGEFTNDLNQPPSAAMSHSADALYKMSELELLAAYAEARREFVEKKFARDTQRARLAWIRAKMFTSSSGGVTERNMAIDVSEEIARKGQEVREMTRELDPVKVEVDIIASVIRFRGAPASVHGEDASEGDSGHEGDRVASTILFLYEISNGGHGAARLCPPYEA
jgi:hypothetical protein